MKRRWYFIDGVPVPRKVYRRRKIFGESKDSVFTVWQEK